MLIYSNVTSALMVFASARGFLVLDRNIGLSVGSHEVTVGRRWRDLTYHGD
jgi:hypothetical protein